MEELEEDAVALHGTLASRELCCAEPFTSSLANPHRVRDHVFKYTQAAVSIGSSLGVCKASQRSIPMHVPP